MEGGSVVSLGLEGNSIVIEFNSLGPMALVLARSWLKNGARCTEKPAPQNQNHPKIWGRSATQYTKNSGPSAMKDAIWFGKIPVSNLFQFVTNLKSSSYR